MGLGLSVINTIKSSNNRETASEISPLKIGNQNHIDNDDVLLKFLLKKHNMKKTQT